MSNPQRHPGPEEILGGIAQLRRLSDDLGVETSRVAEILRQRENQSQLRAGASEKGLNEWREGESLRAREQRDRSLEAADQRALERAARIREAQRNARRTRLDRLEAEEGRRKFELQRDMLRATRDRESRLTSAEASYRALTATLNAWETELTTLEQEARRLLGVYGSGLFRDLTTAGESRPGVSTHDPHSAQQELTDELAAIHDGLFAFRRNVLNKLSRAWPFWLIVVLSPALVVPTLSFSAVAFPTPKDVILAAAASGILGLALHAIGRTLALPRGRVLIGRMRHARALLLRARETAAASHGEERALIDATLAETTQRSDDEWARVLAWLDESKERLQSSIDTRATRATRSHERLRQFHRDLAERRLAIDLARVESEVRQRRDHAGRDHAARSASLTDESRASLQRITERWTTDAQPILSSLEALRNSARGAIASTDCIPASWTPPDHLAVGFRFGCVEAQFDGILAPLPADQRARLVPAGPWNLPLLLRQPDQGSLLLETATVRREAALGTLNHVVCRLLAGTPPGRLALTLFDPVGLGQSFSGLTHLADESAHLINGRVWTQSAQLEERLAELNEHLEKVIQMYLRNEFATIAEYNERAGNIAEKYHYLVLADFPAGFTEVAYRRLLNLATTGARCGVHLLIHWDRRLSPPADFPLAALRQACVWITLDEPEPRLRGQPVSGATIRFDPAPDPDTLTDFIRRVARANLDSNRVEVPFAHIAPADSDLWNSDSSDELKVPIGRTGATKLQYLALGKATRQHALVAGKTGSGKSTLFHVLITNLALWYPPDQVEFYLIDFKKGVEFKCYATHQLPHARVVAIESDREFGLSVLQRLDEELRQRGEKFRAARVQDLSAYRASPGAIPMPRTLLLVDEFQEFFVEEDRIAQNASVLLDRIVRQGRAFGMHVILGSQTLGGAYTVARTTLGQMVVRIALQCSQSDALLIMDEDNSAPRLLSRPGEGIYNDTAGAKAGNSPFQVVWLPDDVREARLRQILSLAAKKSSAGAAPLVFEGDAPANIRDNSAIRRLLAAPRIEESATVRLWLGAPNTIKGPTELTLARRNGDHLLVVGQSDDAMLTLFASALISLAAQHTHGTASFVVLDGSPPDSPDHAFLERIIASMTHEVVLARGAEVGPAVSRLGEALRTRAAGTSPDTLREPTRYLLVHQLQNLKVLRPEDEFSFGSSDAPPSASASFKEMIHEGAAQGIHVLAGIDTYNNVARHLGRKTLSEFGHRVLFQMSANDSASLVDNPVASRLGFHRAVLYLDREGSLEIFRPYSMPDASWITEAGRDLARLGAQPRTL